MQQILMLAQDGGDFLLGFGALFLVGILLGLATLALMIWAVVDAIGNPRLDGVMKLVWVLAIIFFFPPVGALIYLVVGRSMESTTGSSTAGPPPANPHHHYG